MKLLNILILPDELVEKIFNYVYINCIKEKLQ